MRSDKTIMTTAAMAIAFLAITLSPLLSVSTETLLTPAYAYNGSGGLIVPTYGWDSGWSELIRAKHENPGTSIIAIINPSGGPGAAHDSHWSSVVGELQGAGIQVVGYVATSYAGRSVSDVENEIHSYFSWYGVNGIFLDEVSPNALSYYTSIRDFAKQSGGSHIVVLNPGAPVPSSYSSAGDIIVAYENAGLPSHITSNGISRSNLGVLSHGGDPSKSDFANANNEAKYVYGAPDWMHVASNIVDQASWASGKY